MVFFFNDFIFCHKEALPIALNLQHRKTKNTFIEFCNQVQSFEGRVVNCKPVGMSRIKYKNGYLFSGTINDSYHRYGKGMQIENSGTLYIGGFENDLYQGFGKLVDTDKVIFGLFDKGILKIEFNSETIDVGLLKNLQALLPFLKNTMTFEDIQEYANWGAGIVAFGRDH